MRWQGYLQKLQIVAGRRVLEGEGGTLIGLWEGKRDQGLPVMGWGVEKRLMMSLRG
jgi:hypothetical protein